MATKDWRKTVYSKKHINWAKRFSIERVNYWNFSPEKYRVDITLKDGGEDFKVFKTKSQALKYARSYMRKN